jgi:hypothetical protein
MDSSFFLGTPCILYRNVYLSALLLHINFNHAKSHTPPCAQKRGTKFFLHVLIYRVFTLKVEHSQLILCIQFIDIMPLFLYIKELIERKKQY